MENTEENKVETTGAEQTTGQPTEQTSEQSTEQTSEQQVEQPKISELTGGAYESADQLWQDFSQTRQKFEETQQELGKLRERPEPENPYKWVEEDPWAKTVLEKYKSGDDLTPYFEAKAVNYDSLSDRDIVTRRLQRENPNMSRQEIDELVRYEYYLDGNLEDEDLSDHERRQIRTNQLRLKTDANRYRSELKEQQQKFLQPEVTKTETKDEPKEEYDPEKEKQRLRSIDSVKRLEQNKTMQFKYGDGDEDVFKYEVEPDDLIEMMADSSKFYGLFGDDQGNFDVDGLMQVLAFAKNRGQFIKSLINHGKSLGTEKVVEALENPSKPEPEKVTEGGPRDDMDAITEALAKRMFAGN